tara:strand:- start:101 stop:442 length:342 start_codon:yes stop_codon:yes gene_type:complete
MHKFLKNYFFLISIGAIPAVLFRWQIDQVFVVNILGCFLLGFVNALPISRRYKLIFGFAFCGSLTTFSGWSFQLYKFLSEGLYLLFALNSILIILIGLISVFLGDLLAKKIIN